MWRGAITIVFGICVVGSSVVPVSSQTPQPLFDVISIKVNKFGNRNSSIGAAGGRFVAMNVTLRALIKYAYRTRASDLLDSQLVSGPAWMDTERFDVEAKPGGDGRQVSVEEMQLMVRSLLATSFQLKIHREQRQMSVYNLVVAKTGKLKLSEDQPSQAESTGKKEANTPGPPPLGAARLLVGRSGAVLAATAIDMAKLAGSLQVQGDRPIIDRTGLRGLYDIHLEFAPTDLSIPANAGQVGGQAPSSDTSIPSLFSALETQLGLKLQPAKGPVQVILIDHAEKPEAN